MSRRRSPRESAGSRSDSDRLFRRLWLVNAVMVLVALLGVAALLVYAR